jgi:hypothetical protein
MSIAKTCSILRERTQSLRELADAGLAAAANAPQLAVDRLVFLIDRDIAVVLWIGRWSWTMIPTSWLCPRCLSLVAAVRQASTNCQRRSGRCRNYSDLQH